MLSFLRRSECAGLGEEKLSDLFRSPMTPKLYGEVAHVVIDDIDEQEI